jgi:hypothetical protein
MNNLLGLNPSPALYLVDRNGKLFFLAVGGAELPELGDNFKEGIKLNRIALKKFHWCYP